jgi:hypothetical protein
MLCRGRNTLLLWLLAELEVLVVAAALAVCYLGAPKRRRHLE